MTPDAKRENFYDSIAVDFDRIVNHYDLQKRLSVVFDELLSPSLEGQTVLDAGCGTGWFSARAVSCKGKVTSLDTGRKLLEETSKKCDTIRVVGSVLSLPFADDSFDVVISSEVIEHTTNPVLAISEMCRVLKPGGKLVLTTPNKAWYFALKIAEFLRLRPYQGLENWVSRKTLCHELSGQNMTIIECYGIHLFPFYLSAFYPVLDFFHRFRNSLGPVMVNLAVLAEKRK